MDRTCALLLIAGALWGVGSEAAGQTHLYDRDYPDLHYLRSEATDPVARLGRQLAVGERALAWDADRGYLPALLDALGIPVSSQVLVFSRTSLQADHISAATPRAIYFGDDVYVAWVPGSDVLEVAALDPRLGPVFYLLPQQQEGGARAARQNDLCLQCHDTYSLGGGGVPRFLIGSGPTLRSGVSAGHGSWLLTTPRTPVEHRWGGWFVTGRAEGLRHGGNVAREPSGAEVALLPSPLPPDLTGGPMSDMAYLGAHSDVVALLVLEHQLHVQNLMTRAAWEARGGGPSATPARLDRAVRELVAGLTFSGDAGLAVPVQGTSGFASAFAGRGPTDGQGRTLRALDLEARVFRYPLSWQIQSEAFRALPDGIRDRVYAGVTEALRRSGSEEADAALEILAATSADYRAWTGRHSR